MRTFDIPGAWYGDALPSGEWAATIPRAPLQTHLGPLPNPDEPWGIGYPRITNVGGFQVAGQAHSIVNTTWHWRNAWQAISGPCVGISPVIFDRDGHLVISNGSVGSQGFRYVRSNGSIATGDETYGPWHGLSQWSEIGDGLFIGQGQEVGGALVWDGGTLRLLEHGDRRFIRVSRHGDRVAVAMTLPDRVRLIWTTLAELHELPMYLPPPKPKPQPEPIPEPEPPSPVPRPPEPELPTMPESRDTLWANESLATDQELRSRNGRFRLIYQLDGNLVLYDRDWIVLWASGTDGNPGRAIMQDDGNFVVYGSAGIPQWASNTDGMKGVRLVLQNDGNLVIYTADGVPVWASDTVQPNDPPSPPNQLHGRIRVESGRFRDDQGFLGLRFLSEFDAIHRVRIGEEADVVRRFERAAKAGRNGVRVLMMARNLFDLQPSQPGYWSAVDRTVTLALERGLYAELCLFADAQHIMPAHGYRVGLVRAFAAFCREHETVLPQLVNEPAFNGFESAIDPRLLELADLFAAEVGHRDFSIGDPMDVVTDESTGEPLASALRTLAQHSNILVLHGDRKEDPAVYARWVNHLKGFEDFRSRIRPGVALLHDEPMGMAGVRDVPLPNGRTYRREDRADALAAAACVSAVLQIGFTTHYVSMQDDRIPGLMESAVAALVPQRPDMRYVNAGLPGSLIVRFETWDKVRTCTDGVTGWAVAVGQRKGTLVWGDGWQPEIAYGSEHVELWRAVRI